MKPRLFGTNGVRGVYGKDLNIELAINLTYSLAEYYGKGPIVVGYDGRHSSPILSRVVTATLNSSGIDVVESGQIPTPCLQYTAKSKKFNGGIMITASHNPPEYNGIKPCASDGVELSREDELKVENIYYSKKFSKKNGTSKSYYDDSIVDSYIDKVLSLINYEKIKSKKFKIVLDLGNGVQANLAPYLLKKLNCHIITINGNIDGDFPGRGPEPTVDNLKNLSTMVKETKSDFGVAYDGDGDRSIFCDENGMIYPGDKTAAALIDYLLQTKHNDEKIVCPINTTMNVEYVTKKHNSKVIYTKVGSVEVSREMVKQNAIIGLEENGGFMYGKLNQVRDGAMTTALILDMLSDEEYLSNKPNSISSFSGLISSLKKIAQYKTKFTCPNREVANAVVKSCIEHGNPEKVETLDGVKIWIDDQTWLMIRPSGTEPLVRMYAESYTPSLLESKVKEYTRIIENTIQKAD